MSGDTPTVAPDDEMTSGPSDRTPGRPRWSEQVMRRCIHEDPRGDAMPDVDTMLDSLPLDAPLRVPRSATLREVACAMEDARVSCVLVGENPAGLVTDHDLAGALAAGLGGEAVISQVTTNAPVWVSTGTTLFDAVTIMLEHGIRHLPVTSANGEPQGVLSLSTATKLLLDVSVPVEHWPWE